MLYELHRMKVCAAWGFSSAQPGDAQGTGEPRSPAQPVLEWRALQLQLPETGLLLLCCVWQFQLLADSQNLNVQAFFYNKICQHIQYFYFSFIIIPLLISEKDTGSLKTEIWRVAIVVVDKQFDENATEMSFLLWKLVNQLQKQFPNPVWFYCVWPGHLISTSSCWEQRGNFISSFTFMCLEKRGRY